MSRRVVVSRQGSGGPVLLVFFAALVGVAIAGSVFLSTIGLPEIDLDEFDQEPTVQVDDQYALDEDGLRWMLRRYRSEFGNAVALRAVYYDSYAIFDVPQDGDLYRGWIYRAGGFTEMSTPRENPAGQRPVNLARVDYAELAANVARAPRMLGVADGTVSHVIVGHDPFEGDSTIAIHVTNTVGGNGFMKTDLQGEVLRKFP